MISYWCIHSINCSFLILFDGPDRFRIAVRQRSWFDIFITSSVSIAFYIGLIVFKFISFVFISFIAPLYRRFTSLFVNLFMCLRILIFSLRFSFLSIFVYYFIFDLIIDALRLLSLIFGIYLSIWINSSLISIWSCSWLISISKIIIPIIAHIIFSQEL